MAFAYDLTFPAVGATLPLTASVVDRTNTPLGSQPAYTITTLGGDWYHYYTDAMPDGHRGAVKISDATAAVQACGGVSPQEVENADAKTSTRLASASYTAPDNAGIDAIETAAASLVTAVAAVQADTDNIQTRLPAALDGGRMDVSVGAVQTNAITAAGVHSDVGTELATAMLDLAAGVETGLTPRQLFRAIASALMCECTVDEDAGTVTFRDFADSKNRLTATVGSDGSRTAITRDLT